MRVAHDLSGSDVAPFLDKQETGETLKAKDIVAYYVENFPEVFVVSCTKCKQKLALEYLDPSNLNPNHHDGRQVIAISEQLRSYRARLDKVMGYQCACGNSTKLGKIEEGIVPVALRLKDGTLQIPDGGMEIHPHHHFAVQDRVKETGYVPKVATKGDVTTIETFSVRRLK